MSKKLLFLYLIITINIFPQDTLTINAEYIPHTDTTLVFVPHNYNPANKYPLLFMLHGYSGNYNQWNGLVNLDSAATKYGFIIVCPDGFYDSWYVNSPMKKNSQYEKFFFENLVPKVFDKYNVDKDNIFITGLSMGGHGAMYYFLKHPDFFKSAGSTSGILDLNPFPENWSLPKVLGSHTLHPKAWNNNSDINLLKDLKNKNRPIIIDCGTEDFAFKVYEAFRDECIKLGIPVKAYQRPGEHNGDYWKKSIIRHFEFFKSLVKEK